ncbi:MAG: DUF2971 domain-containing protein [Marinobacter sp.]|nr:DUF2971 domain-containing protein [Marinobacter sp.]|tara:strand:+ start:1190 stop:2002 length:813 start_codon:yes stop_codon:yes gene_type:complete
MILYKYVSLEAGMKIMESQAVGFSEARDFNDPFETAARPRSEDGSNLPFLFSCNNHTTNYWSSNFAVLSLTRQPLNKLMLAHYADDHKGMVLGFDVSKIPEFTSEEWAFIPAQSGNVIYTATMPTHPPISTDSHSIESSESVSLETRQRAFLFKGADWALEEEVRIVKFLRGYERFFDVIYLGDRPLYLYEIPSDSLVEVHLGCRAKVLPATNGEHCNWLRLKKAMKTFESCRLFHIDVDLNSWEVTSREVEPVAYDGYWQLHFDRRALD